MNRAADALIRAAAADVTLHRRIDISVCRLRFCRQQRRGRHDLPRLTVAALGNILCDPSSLNRVAAIRRHPFDSGDFLSLRGCNRRAARTNRLTIEMNRASSALGDPATELGAGNAEVLTQHPEERSVAACIYLVFLAVDDERNHGSLLSNPTLRKIISLAFDEPSVSLD